MRDLPWRNTWSSDNPVEVLNEHLYMLVGRYVPTKIIRVRNKDKPWFDDLCRRAFDSKQEAHLRWTRDRSRVNWEEFVHCVCEEFVHWCVSRLERLICCQIILTASSPGSLFIFWSLAIRLLL